SVAQGGLPVASVDDAGITHVSTTVVGDVGSYFTLGWTNIYPGFGGFGKDALMFVIASNFVAVPPVFVQQPTNMFYQPPYGLTNAALARAWPAPNYYWVMNATNKLRAQTNYALALGPTGFTNQTSYFVIASNAYGLATSTVVTATANLSFAVSPPTNAYVVVGTTLSLFGSGASASPISYQWRLSGTNLPGANGTTLALSGITATQAGSYTLVMSNASTVLTSTPPTVVTVLAVGSVDPGYVSVGGSAGLLRVADGSFYGVDSYNAYHINPNGSIDTNGFLNPYAAGAHWSDQGASRGPNAIARDPDGKLLLGGGFTMFNTTNVNRLARLNTNGSLDLSFSVGTGPVDVPDGNAGYYTQVNQVLSLTNGQYLVAGAFNVFNGLARTNLVRLNHDGSVDTSFANHAFRPALSQNTAFFGNVHTLALLPDGKILAGGEFETVDGVTNNDLVRLNPNGTLDPTFTPGNLQLPYLGRINALQPLPDGKLLAVGAFYNMTNTAIIRYNTNGVRDTTWLGLLPGQAFSIVGVQSNKFIIGGNSYVKRLNYDGSNDANFDPGTFFSLNGYFTYVLVLEPSGNVMAGGTTYGLRRLLLEPIPVVVPSFSSGSGVAVVNGHMQFSACGGVDGQTVYVQASMDLANWQTVSTNVVTGGCISYIDPQIPAPPNRYYRLNTVP
ncbi:MAG TPA: hypothetical protein VG347_07745, partial [Verrucomicrobiae bacterium]|nr:hypothetical protein [Verrucomicrobiae bacterium]